MEFKLIFLLLIGVSAVWSTGEKTSTSNVVSNNNRQPKQGFAFLSSFERIFGTQAPPTASTLKSTSRDRTKNIPHHASVGNKNRDRFSEYGNGDKVFFEDNPFSQIEANPLTITIGDTKNESNAEINTDAKQNIVIVYCTDPITKTIIAKYDKESAMGEYKNAMVVKEENMAEWSSIADLTPAPMEFVTKNITMSIRGRIHHCQVLTVPSNSLIIETQQVSELTNDTSSSGGIIPTTITDPIKTIVSTGTNILDSMRGSENTDASQAKEKVGVTSSLNESESTTSSTTLESVAKNQTTILSENETSPSNESGQVEIVTMKDQNHEPQNSGKEPERPLVHGSFILESYETLFSDDDESDEGSSSSATHELLNEERISCVAPCSPLFISSSSKKKGFVQQASLSGHFLHNRFNQDSSQSMESVEDGEEVYISNKGPMKYKNKKGDEDIIGSDFDRVNDYSSSAHYAFGFL